MSYFTLRAECMKAEQTLSDVGKSLVYNVGLRPAEEPEIELSRMSTVCRNDDDRNPAKAAGI